MAEKDTIAELLSLIEARRGGDVRESYTAQLLADKERALKKLGEEAVELVVAGLADDKKEIRGEAADLLYHFLVALAALDVSWQSVLETLEARQGQSGLVEKAARKSRS